MVLCMIGLCKKLKITSNDERKISIAMETAINNDKQGDEKKNIILTKPNVYHSDDSLPDTRYASRI